jgi:hypothetical protein
MKFIIGLEMMSREDKTALLAQLEAITAIGVLLEAGGKVGLHLKRAVFSGGAAIARKVSEGAAKWLGELGETLDWDPEEIHKRIEETMRELSSLSDRDFYVRWRFALSELAGVKPPSTLADVGRAILNHAARSVGIKSNGYQDSDAMEFDTVARCIQEVLSDLRTRFAKATPEELARLEAILEGEVARLSPDDIETLRKYLGVERITAKVLVGFLTSAGGFGLAQALIAGEGFAPYLVLTTTMKAVSVWIGVTFPFAAYTTATSALAAFLGLWTLLSIGAIIGAVGFHSLGNKLHEALSKMVVIIGWVRAADPIGPA